MKKILLCTTALVALSSAVVFAEEAASESKIKLTLHGSSTIETGVTRQDVNHRAPLKFSPNQKNKGIYSKSKVSLKGEGYGDNGVVYGAVVRLAILPTQANGLSGRPARSHAYFDNDLFSVDVGSNGSVSGLMGVDIGNIAPATGGATDGDAMTFMNTNPAGNNANISDEQKKLLDGLVTTSSFNRFNDMDFNGESARKISVISSRMSGLQFGISLTPDMENTGAGLNTNTYLGSTLKIKNVVSTAVNYLNTFNDVSVNLAATMDKGKVSKVDGYTGLNYPVKRHGLSSYTFGGIVGVNGFKASLGYGTDGKSFAPIDRKFSSSWWTGGVTFESGPMTTGLSYMYGVKGNKNEVSTSNTPLPYVTTRVYSFGVDYKVAEGVKPFAEVTMVSIKGKNLYQAGYGVNSTNRATVLIFGSKFSF